jgi:hypothetical protein
VTKNFFEGSGGVFRGSVRDRRAVGEEEKFFFAFVGAGGIRTKRRKRRCRRSGEWLEIGK